ncbi:hypothetical protein HCN51_43825 [Nonomuraea sp. FMUSA5-5]|uniref:Uncharacterized protein n=1 Tax=Nonomuraea composti TaxID=2720023 RepID=A0ABX1BIA9_9ACTN|nr:hypothetical protein [Nonomuraea sp. FMUSA5-5]NJP96290.1 hypothetical protein [Nonomuraea sp. FMUSA5-5]
MDGGIARRHQGDDLRQRRRFALGEVEQVIGADAVARQVVAAQVAVAGDAAVGDLSGPCR